MATGSNNDDGVLGEDAIVQGYLARLADNPSAMGLRDDCAELRPGPGQAFILKTDPIRAGVHFLPTDAPGDIAWKALAVNVSDLAAKAARPVAYLLSLSFPEPPRAEWLEAFASGLAAAQDAFGMSLIGGDTDRAPGPLSMAVTAIGEMPMGKMVPRTAARPGDILLVSGMLGDAALGLAVNQNGQAAQKLSLSPSDAEFCRQRYLRPQPRIGARAALRAYACAAMDISDGLIKDAARMMDASGCQGIINVAEVPLSPAFRRVLDQDGAQVRAAIAHGDDYELLVAVAPDDVEAFRSLAAAGGVMMTQIGSCKAGAGLTTIGFDGGLMDLGKTGYDHFGET